MPPSRPIQPAFPVHVVIPSFRSGFIFLLLQMPQAGQQNPFQLKKPQEQQIKIQIKSTQNNTESVGENTHKEQPWESGQQAAQSPWPEPKKVRGALPDSWRRARGEPHLLLSASCSGTAQWGLVSRPARQPQGSNQTFLTCLAVCGSEMMGHTWSPPPQPSLAPVRLCTSWSMSLAIHLPRAFLCKEHSPPPPNASAIEVSCS